MLSAQQQEFFSTTDCESSFAWRSNVSKTRELLATLRQILSGEGTVSLEFGADDAWRLSVGGIIFSDRRFLGSYQPLGRVNGVRPGVALGILTGGKVRFRRDSTAAVSCGQSSFLLPVNVGSAPVHAPPKPFALGDLNWIEQALVSAEFCLVRPGGQFSAASSWLGAIIGPVRNWRFHVIVDSQLLRRALRAGPYFEYAFTPARLWMYGKYLSCEIPGESRRSAFDPSPLVGKVQSYPVRIEVDGGACTRWGEIYKYLTVEIATDGLIIRDNRKQIRLAGEPAGSSAVKQWRVRSRPLLYALSRGERANVYLPERKLDPIGIECGGRWMWILAEGDNPPSVGRAATGGLLNVNSLRTTNGTPVASFPFI